MQREYYSSAFTARKVRRTRSKIEFFPQVCAANIPSTDLMLIEKAKTLAEVTHIDDFKASNGWSESFKTHHNILPRCLRLCPED
jgi:hypothetical protein